MTQPAPHQIVIIGAGFAGLRTALELEKRRARLGACQITLLDKHGEHIYTPLLYEVCTGELGKSKQYCVEDLSSGVCVRLEEYRRILRSKHIRFKRGEVQGVDPTERRIQLKDGTHLPFDHVVVALGAETATFGVPGVREYASFMKGLSDAFRVRQRLAEFLNAYLEGREERVEVVIVGAGPTGTETAAELANFFQKLVATKIIKPKASDVVLIEAGPDILAMYPEAFRTRAKARLRRLGVTLMPNTKVLEVNARSVRTSTGNVTADLVIWSGGIQPLPLVKNLGLPTDERGWIQVEPTLRVAGMLQVFALGDCAVVFHPKTGKRVPTLGQAAVKEAAFVAENLVRSLERKPLVTFHPPDHWKTAVPLGGKHAMADFGSWFLSGFFGYGIRKLADLLYFFSILSLLDALRMWVRGARVYMRND